MSASPLTIPLPDRARSLRVALGDGGATTVHVASYDRAQTDLRVIRLRRRAPLEAWCAQHGVGEALVGGFYVRPDGTPLGELRTRGIARTHVAFTAPWDAERACVQVFRGEVRIAARPELGTAPRGDLLQAGPLLVRDARAVVRDGVDPEGFSAGAQQFDSDITAGRHPRAALAIAGDRLLAVACDGRTDDEAGLTLGELADTLVGLGAGVAMNLDGGGSTSLVSGGRLCNRPHEAHNRPIPGGRAVSTALVFAHRA